eukprot:2621298-Amphidinium_carterae.1
MTVPSSSKQASTQPRLWLNVKTSQLAVQTSGVETTETITDEQFQPVAEASGCPIQGVDPEHNGIDQITTWTSF